MAHAGYSGKVSIGGTSTAFTGEACTLVSGTTYQIDAAAKRAWNPSVAVSAYDGGSPATISSVNYLYGTVTLSGAPSGAVTVTGEYYPLHEVTTAKAVSLSMSCLAADSSVFSSTVTARLRTPTLFDAEVRLSALEQGNTDHDSGAGTRYLNELLTGAVRIYIQIKLGASLKTWSAYVLPVTDEQSGEVAGLNEKSLTFQLSSGVLGATFAFSA